MEILAKLFGNEEKVKVIKLFLFNSETTFTLSEIRLRTKSQVSKLKKELNNLESLHLIRKRRGGKIRTYRYFLNRDFAYLGSLQDFFLSTEPLLPEKIIKKLNRLGSIKLVLVSGVFIKDSESRVDMLVVGDNVKRASLEKTMGVIESEVGKEIKYAYFSTEDFKYRLSMFDKLIRDVLDYPHKIVLNKLGNV